MSRNELKYLFLIIVIFVTACIETDIYLPAFVDMMQAFQVSEEAIQSLLTWNFFGICISCPVYGPLSDSFGRKKPLLVALGLFFAGSIMTIFAVSFEVMLWGRLLQGLGSGGCFTLGTAIIFDSFRAERAIWAMNKLNVIIPLIMGGAPLLGAVLNLTFGFRSNFIAIAVFVFISLIVSIFFLEETLPKEKRSELKVQKLFADFKTVLTSVPFWQLCGVVCLIYGGYLAFLSGTAVLFVVEFGMAKSLFPLYQGAILAAWVIGSLTCDRALQKWGGKKLKKIGSILLFMGGVGLGITALLLPLDPNVLTFFMFLFTFGANWASGLYYGESMEVFPDMKGIAASILTSARLLFSALAIAAVGKFYNATIYPIAGAVCLTVACSLPLIFFYEKKNQEKTMLGVSSLTH